MELLDEGARREIAKNIDIVDEGNCLNCDCEDDIVAGEKVFDKMVIEKDTQLYNTSKIPNVHFIIPTSQMDWQFDACKEKPASVQYKISEWCETNAERFTAPDGATVSFNCNVTSMPINILDIEAMRGTKNNVLVLPYGFWINDLRSDQVAETLDKLVPDLLDDQLDLKNLIESHANYAEARSKAYVFICSHTTRDKRCGIAAPILKKLFDKDLQRHGLYRDNSDLRGDGVTVEYINHVGGHKFAANVQIYLKNQRTLVWLGRITPKNVPHIVNHLLVPENGKLPFPENVRCVKKYQSW
ncbi:Actin patches distal protein 1 [Nakaseomyces bracarensis]|uniref:Actin patches distal protein 1 n=1 Tax=Nakaseomyces bracarensis TaxID=273131 RepID=A0ABR4NWY4_9SACH